MRMQDFPVGSYVETGSGENLSFGTVLGLSVNAFGEPLLVVSFIRRSIFAANDSATQMNLLGWSPAKFDTTGMFYERVSTIHPANLRPLDSNSVMAQ